MVPPGIGPNSRAKGTGTVFQRHDHKTCPPRDESGERPEHKCKGRWAGAIDVKAADGKRRYITVYGKTKGEASAKINEVRRKKEANNGNLPTGGTIVSQLMDTWFTDVAEKEHRPKTVANFHSVSEKHIKPAIGKMKLANLEPSHVRKVTAAIEAKGIGTPTAVLAYRVLSLALEHAYREGAVTENVAKRVKRPAAAPTNLAILTAQDGRKLLQTIRHERLVSLRVANLSTAARQGELLGLELDRVGDYLEFSWQLQRVIWQHGCGDFKAEKNAAGKPVKVWPCGKKIGASCPDRLVKFPRNSEHRHLEGGFWLVRPKTKKGWRVVPLRGTLRTLVEMRIDAAASEPNPHGLLWTSDPKKDRHGRLQPLDGSPIDASQDNAAWHEQLERAGVHSARLHDARHTGASMMLERGIPEKTIMQLMGHSSFVTTRNYQNVSGGQLEEAADAMGSVLGFELEAGPSSGGK